MRNTERIVRNVIVLREVGTTIGGGREEGGGGTKFHVM
jgi:hypothetical protein